MYIVSTIIVKKNVVFWNCIIHSVFELIKYTSSHRKVCNVFMFETNLK